ncbi:hypothetical protein [Actinomadura sp. DC4]|uniref:hypothetical protein n=1 Tax=Actinomadura sp. DC4 TaxID=3055069 RepID=UPI0025AF4326|nr:hypothetical protein [Actinomadura sp. DC4]MDN3353043.1 hypothetical protein [Actinomadura sp. DC4]
MRPPLTRTGTAPVPYGPSGEGTGRPQPPETPVGPRSASETIIGMALTATWMLTTGRRLDQPPLLHELTADQLVDFWADDHNGGTASGSRPAQRCDMTDSPTFESPTRVTDPTHCGMITIDIAEFGRRDSEVQVFLREAVYRIAKAACTASGVPWDACHVEDRGDGLVLIAPPDVSVLSLLDPLIFQVRAALRTHNRTASSAARLRLRIAVHAGYVRFDSHGATGSQVIHLFRMVDAPSVKSEFAASGGDWIVVVSDYLYQEVILAGPGLIDPEVFAPVVVSVKETYCLAWVWLPQRGRGGTPVRPADLPPYGPRHVRRIHRRRDGGS